MSINALYKNSILSCVAYAKWNGQDFQVDQLSSLGLTLGQINILFKTPGRGFEIISHKEYNSGFSATLFLDRETGQLTVAFRGTESTSITDLGNDLLLALGIQSFADFLDMGQNDSTERFLQDAGLVDEYGNPRVPPNSVNFVGHSLGGHLAIMAAHKFPNLVDLVYTYNGAGLSTFDALWANSIENSVMASGFNPATDVINVYADKGLEVTSNSATFWRPGIRKNIFIEEGGGISNHSAAKLVQSLSVYRLLAKIDPDLDSSYGMAEIYDMLDSASNMAHNSLETVTAALWMATLQEDSALLSDVELFWQWFDHHNAFYDVESLAFRHPDELADRAGQDSLGGQAYRYALLELVPFALVSNVEQTRASVSRYDLENFTEDYLKDRAALLSVLSVRNALDKTGDESVNISWWDEAYFYDGTTDQGININGAEADEEDVQRIIFGSEEANEIFGKEENDHLYGMAGDDTLRGHNGADYLEGGEGSDHYVVDIEDRIFDVDVDTHAGSMTFVKEDGREVLLRGATRNGFDPADVYYDALADVTYFLAGTDLFISEGKWNPHEWVPGEDGRKIAKTLDPEKCLKLTDFSNGMFGITLDYQVTPGANGNYLWLDESASTLKGTDANDEIAENAFAPGRIGLGGGGNDFLEVVYGHAHLDGGDGMDTLLGGERGSVLVGGAGQDVFNITQLGRDMAGGSGEAVIINFNGYNRGDYRRDILKSWAWDNVRFWREGDDLLVQSSYVREGVTYPESTARIVNQFVEDSSGGQWGVNKIEVIYGARSNEKKTYEADGFANLLQLTPVTIVASSNQTVQGSSDQDDHVRGSEVADVLTNGPGVNLFDGRQGDDIYVDNDGHNTYLLARDGGRDLVRSGQKDRTTDEDRIYVMDEHTRFYGEGYDLVVQSGSAQGELLVEDFFRNPQQASFKRVENMAGAVWEAADIPAAINPDFRKDRIYIHKNHTVLLGVENLLRNDSLRDPASARLEVDAGYGLSISWEQDNQYLRIIPENGLVGEASFNYRMTYDGSDYSAWTNVTVNVVDGAIDGNTYDYNSAVFRKGNIIIGGGQGSLSGNSAHNMDDIFYDGAGDDIFLLGGNNGWDRMVIRETQPGSKNILRFNTSVVAEELALYRVLDDLVIHHKIRSSDRITVEGFFKDNDSQNALTAMEFSNGLVWDYETIRRKALLASASSGNDEIRGYETDDVLEGGAGKDIFIFKPGDGRDTIINSHVGDVIELAVDPDSVYITRDGNDYLVHYRDNNEDSIRIVGNGGLDRIQFGNDPGETWVLEDWDHSGVDHVVTIAKNNSMSGGDDWFLLDDINQLLRNDPLPTGTWQVIDARPLRGITPSEFYFGELFGQQGLAVRPQQGAEGVVEYFFRRTEGGAIYRGELTMDFEADIILTGSTGEDMLDNMDGQLTYLVGGAGDDLFLGGQGVSIVQYDGSAAAQEGSDVLVMYEGRADSDVLALVNVKPEEIRFEQQGFSLLVHLASNGQVLCVEDYFQANTARGPWVRRGELAGIFVFDNVAAYDQFRQYWVPEVMAGRDPAGNFHSVVYTAREMGWEGEMIIRDGRARLRMTEGDDVADLNTLNEVDQVNGLGGDDVLSGRDGNDVLAGGSGSDSYQFFAGDGQDILANRDGMADAVDVDQLVFYDLVDYRDLWLQQVDADLVVSVLGSNDRVTVKNWFADEAPGLRDENELDLIAVHSSADHWQLHNQQDTELGLNDRFDRLLQAMASWQSEHPGVAADRNVLAQDIYDHSWLSV